MSKDHVIKTVIFIAICACISACLQVFADQFIYWRELVLAQPWRLWTAHWVHVGWMHFLLNLLAFACLPFIFPHLKIRHIVLLLLLLSPFISLGFYWALPYVEAYAGLSGVLHGLYVAIAIFSLRYKEERNFAILVLGLVLAKLLWENTWGSSSTTAQLIGSPILVEAHSLGSLGGALLASIYSLWHYNIQNVKIGKTNR